jgi:hypothetical protein
MRDKYSMLISEIISSKNNNQPLSPSEARIRSLSHMVKISRERLSQERDRQRRSREIERKRKFVSDLS